MPNSAGGFPSSKYACSTPLKSRTELMVGASTANRFLFLRTLRLSPYVVNRLLSDELLTRSVPSAKAMAPAEIPVAIVAAVAPSPPRTEVPDAVDSDSDCDSADSSNASIPQPAEPPVVETQTESIQAPEQTGKSFDSLAKSIAWDKWDAIHAVELLHCFDNIIYKDLETEAGQRRPIKPQLREEFSVENLQALSGLGRANPDLYDDAQLLPILAYKSAYMQLSGAKAVDALLTHEDPWLVLKSASVMSANDDPSNTPTI
jgi:hypothetical protein